MAITAVIYDMNGVLVDTDRWHREAFRRVLAEFGQTMSDQDYQECCAGRTEREGLVDLLHKKGIQADVEAGVVRKVHYYQDIAQVFPQAYTGAQAAIPSLASHYSLALASSSRRADVDSVLQALGLAEHFRTTVSGEDVSTGKPNLEIYRLAAQCLGVKPAECVVIEDAHSGVVAAKRAGMRCIAIAQTNPREALVQADVLVDRLDQLSPTLMEAL
jgi:HAD superfamily hydrolase (TIGR01509 family)